MNKISKRIILAIICLFEVFFTGCSNKSEEFIVKDDSKVLVKVGEVNITQEQLDSSMMNTYFTEKQMLEKLIDDQLLLIKAKKLNISVSDEEVKSVLEEQKKQFEQIDNKDKSKEIIKSYINKLGVTEEQYWNTVAFKVYKNLMIIGKTKEQLGSSVDTVLSELRNKTKIEYF